jgi:quinol monooxygenase YgiN
MFTASVVFDVQPDKRGELLSAIGGIVPAVRGTPGCGRCRLVCDCENQHVLVLISEWDNRVFLETYLASREFRVLEGARFLLRDGPSVSIDEVLWRRELAHPWNGKHQVVEGRC